MLHRRQYMRDIIQKIKYNNKNPHAKSEFPQVEANPPPHPIVHNSAAPEYRGLFGGDTAVPVLLKP